MRPLLHYAPRANWLSDPNGLVFHAGEWHMAYQTNPEGEEWGHLAWGHAVSPDLARWTELPPALVEEAGVMIYSGSAVVDHGDSAGFGAGALVAIYTGADHAADRQTQCLASSIDNGRHWIKYAGNPVLDADLADFRDPNVFWHAGTGRWVMVVVRATEDRAALYASPDLRCWTLLTLIETDGAPGHLWECPLLIELPVEGAGQSRWLFKVDVLSGAPGSGALYRVGHFDGRRFVAETPWQLADHGRDFYAAIAWHDPRDAVGRPAWIGWMGNHAVQKHLPHQGWRGAMSVPRRMSLVQTPAGPVLRQSIEPSTLARFAPPRPWPLGPAPVSCPSAALIALDRDAALTIADGEGRRIAIAREPGMARLIRRDPITPELDADASMAASSALTILLDHGSIELFADDGLAVMTMQHRLGGAAWSIRADRTVLAALHPLSA